MRYLRRAKIYEGRICYFKGAAKRKRVNLEPFSSQGALFPKGPEIE